MKVPPKRKGNVPTEHATAKYAPASMKVPPKRKGNLPPGQYTARFKIGLNESPSEKEGKSVTIEEYNGATPYQPQ